MQLHTENNRRNALSEAIHAEGGLECTLCFVVQPDLLVAFSCDVHDCTLSRTGIVLTAPALHRPLALLRALIG